MAWPGLMAALVVCVVSGLVQAQPNILPNGSFELVEPPAPTAELVKANQAPPPETYLPRTWNLWGQWGATARLPEGTGRTGSRAVEFAAKQGQCWLRYHGLPVVDSQPWTVRLRTRGQGKLIISAYDVTKDQWAPSPLQTIDLKPEWSETTAMWTPPAECKKWALDLASQGPTECFIDDVVVTHPLFKPLDLPPMKPLTRDDHTLLLLDFEQPLNEDAFYVGGQVTYEEGMPGYGKCLRLGPEAYVACSADENLNPLAGTIEAWVKLMEPGNNSFAQGFVTIPGPEGLWFGKDQYSHVGFGISSGWGRVSGATAMGYAGGWQPCWRHVAVSWDQEAIEVFVDGKLIAWENKPKLLRTLGPELRIGAPGMLLDDVRISDVARYRLPTP